MDNTSIPVNVTDDIDLSSGLISDNGPCFRVFLPELKFEPQDDMTPIEAVYCSLALGVHMVDPRNESWWTTISRHFVEVGSE